MPLFITNSSTGKKEEFKPINLDSVSMYFCGLTVSDMPHLGHARAWVHVDTMRRWLEHSGYDVTYIENFTDINEKIVARIGESDYGSSEPEVASYFINKALHDMESLGLKRANAYPKATEHIPEILNLISSLIDSGNAYESNGSVYFDVESFQDYGKLSNPNLNDTSFSNSKIESLEKRHRNDFALWKSGPVAPESISKHRDPSLPSINTPTGSIWDSPWGPGRPGWHIECSAMSLTHLSDRIDIHVGGQDLIFPHHENEKAQSEAFTGKPFANLWVHIRLLETQGEKMSSSLKNYFSVSNSISEFGSNSIRMFLLSTSYHQHQAYSEVALHEAVERWGRLKRTYLRTISAVESSSSHSKLTDSNLKNSLKLFRDNFYVAMDDDFNTREAIVAIFGITNLLNQYLDSNDQYDYKSLNYALQLLDTLSSDILGLSFENNHGSDALSSDLINLIISLRNQERESGHYDRADALRTKLESLGIIIEDTDQSSTYRIK